jgi:NAD(P)-dependent dehydrogenase (short-subunit alcohol dehydrogenase family)
LAGCGDGQAGVDTKGKRSIMDIDEDARDAVIAVNLKRAWLVIKQVAPHMSSASTRSTPAPPKRRWQRSAALPTAPRDPMPVARPRGW